MNSGLNIVESGGVLMRLAVIRAAFYMIFDPKSAAINEELRLVNESAPRRDV